MQDLERGWCPKNADCKPSIVLWGRNFKPYKEFLLYFIFINLSAQEVRICTEFCFNSKWNFFENHSSEELEEHIKDDAVWSRKTSPINQDNKVHTEGRSWARMGFDDPHEILGSKGTKDPSEHVTSVSQKRLPPSERKALEILDARDTMSKEQIRKIYKALVKDLHPDMNGGRRDDEDRLTEVVWAWDQIKTSRSFKE